MITSAVTRQDQSVLTADQVTVEFAAHTPHGVKALDDVSLDIKAAGITGLVGRDGSGKTTLLRVAAGLVVPTHGRMRVLNLDSVADTLAIRGHIGYMPQQFGLYEELTVRENLDLYADMQGVPRSERRNRYDRLMQMSGLGPFTGRRVGRLSGGMQQKLGLACALVESPSLLLLDEPTVGVDPVSRRDLWDILTELVESEGLSVLLSTAYLDEAEQCDHVIVLEAGRVLQEGAPHSFHHRVRNRVCLARPAEGASPRDLHAEVSRHDNVIDATIRSGRVRVVLVRDGIQDKCCRSSGLCGSIETTEPSFEDAFVDMLIRQKDVQQSSSPTEPDEKSPDRYQNDITVSVQGLTKRFGDFTAVQDISFEVERGAVFGLLGPNGAGKSTTFRMLCGLLAVTEGQASVAGRDLRKARARARARLGYMAQKFSLYRQLTVEQNLHFYGRAYGLSGRKLRDRIQWALDEFDLEAHRDQSAEELAGGYRQRLAMAAALLHEPDILFLDEPTSGADPLARREFWLRINGFARTGVTVIVTTHFMEEAEYCDRLLIMSQGTELAQGTPAEIRRLARTDEVPEPTIEDAFIALAEGYVKPVEKSD